MPVAHRDREAGEAATRLSRAARRRSAPGRARQRDARQVRRLPPGATGKRDRHDRCGPGARGAASRDAVRRRRGPRALRPAAAVQRARGLPARVRVALHVAWRHQPRGGRRHGGRPTISTPGAAPAGRPAFITVSAGSKELRTDELVISGLEVSIGAKKILNRLDLSVRQGEVHALMGPNGSGKTSLAFTLMGHPEYKVDAGTVTWRGQDLLTLSPDKRARLGVFLAFQYPSAIPGVTVASFLRNIYNAVHHPKPLDESRSEARRGGEEGQARR